MVNELVRGDQNEHSVWKGVVAGVVGGLAASWAMNCFQGLWSEASGNEKRSELAHSPRQDGRRESVERGRSAGAEDAPGTVKAASAISEAIFDHELTTSERAPAATAMHYAFGAGAGAVYGALADLTPIVTAGSGLPYGAAVWLLADETMVPALGLSKPPLEYPLSDHTFSFLAHMVYGGTLEVTRRVVRSLL